MNATLQPDGTRQCALASECVLSSPVLLLGLGNDILCDDAIGLRVAREVRRRLDSTAGIEVVDTEEMGLALLDFIIGHQEVVIVDAAETGQAEPGFVHELGISDLKCLRAGAPHSLGLGEAIALGRVLGMQVPKRVKILAVEVEDARTLGTQLTPRLQAAFPQIVEQVLMKLTELGGRACGHSIRSNGGRPEHHLRAGKTDTNRKIELDT